MFEPPLKHIYTGSGGKKPRPEEPQGLVDLFRAKVVEIKGPSICKQLNAELGYLREQHTEKGVAKDVTTHFALQAISTRVATMRDVIQQGGTEAYSKMKEAARYVERLHKMGLDA